MKKIVLMLTAAIIFAWQGSSFAASSSVDALIQKLQDKGILTSDEATQLKGEIATNEQAQQASQQTTFKGLLPDWINSIKITGDFRLRDQIQVRKVPGGLSSQSGSNFDQNRVRLRARLNFEDQVNDKVKVVVGIATDGGTSRSNNYTFGGSTSSNKDGVTFADTFGKPEVILNKAYVVYTPNDMITMMGGKLDNPVWEPANASFFWDPDITPEGGAIQVQKKINDYITPWAQEAVFVLHDQTPNTNSTTTQVTKTDPFMLVTQGGIKGNLTEKLYYKAGVTWYDISNPNHITFGEGLGTNSVVAGTSYANSHLMYNFNDVIVEGLDVGLNDPFGDILPSPIYIPQIGVFGDFADNASNDSDVTAKNTQNKAWEIGGYMGSSALNGWGTWKFQSYYKVIERDSWLDVLPDDDFYSGYTDTKGWRSQLDIGLAKNVWFTLAYFHTSVFKEYPTMPGYVLASSSNNTAAFSRSAPENLFQMDLNFKF